MRYITCKLQLLLCVCVCVSKKQESAPNIFIFSIFGGRTRLPADGILAAARALLQYVRVRVRMRAGFWGFNLGFYTQL